MYLKENIVNRQILKVDWFGSQLIHFIFQRNEEIEEGLKTFNVQKYIPRQSSNMSEASGICDIDTLDRESSNDMSSMASSSDTASDGNHS